MTDISQIIVGNLTKSYVFYIPRSVQSMLEDSDFKGIIPDNSYNSIAYYNNLGKAFTTDFEDVIIIDIIGKQRLLNKNLVILLDAQSSLSKAAFNLIFEDYRKQIEYQIQITSWMYKNITNIFPNIADVFIRAFKIQANCFDVHYSHLDTHFQFKVEHVTLNENQVLKNFETALSKNSPERKLFKLNTDQLAKINKATPTSKNKIVITDDQIDLFLLQTVFGVEF
jgi:hypothetical protein